MTDDKRHKQHAGYKSALLDEHPHKGVSLDIRQAPHATVPSMATITQHGDCIHWQKGSLLKRTEICVKRASAHLFTQASSFEVSLHSSVVCQQCLQPPLIVTLLGRLLVGAVLQLLQAALKLLQLAFKNILLLAQFVHLQMQLSTLTLKAEYADSIKLDFLNLTFPVV